MTSILLISLPSEPSVLFRASKSNPSGKVSEQRGPNSSYSLGIPYIHAYLESKGHTVHSIDLSQRRREYIFSEVDDAISLILPDFIGIQIITQTRTYACKLIQSIHEYYPDIKIVVGGIHATIMYDQIIREYPYVTVIIGEGENTFHELLTSPNPPDGIAYWDGKDVTVTPAREPVQNLDILPFPKHELYIYENKTTATVITSRGCNISCSFCCLNPKAKRSVRFRSNENVVCEIASIHSNYPHITNISFMDDSFCSNTDRVIELCELIIKHGLDHLNYSCVARFKPLNRETLRYMELAGFKEISFGLESANEEILKKCHKNLKQSDIVNAITMLKEFKINYNLYIIVGLPGETKETIEETASFIQKLQKIKYSIITDATLLAVYPGTEIYRDLIKKGKISDSYWLSVEPTPVYTYEHSFNELLELKEALLNKISLLPISYSHVRNQIPNSYSILRYILNKGGINI